MITKNPNLTLIKIIIMISPNIKMIGFVNIVMKIISLEEPSVIDATKKKQIISIVILIKIIKIRCCTKMRDIIIKNNLNKKIRLKKHGLKNKFKTD